MALSDLATQLDLALQDVTAKKAAADSANTAATKAQQDLTTSIAKARDLKQQFDQSVTGVLGDISGRVR